jgi:hypothetical protein
MLHGSFSAFLHAPFSFMMDFPPLADCFRCPPISTHLFSCRAYFRSAKRGKKMQTRLFRFLPCFLLAIKTFPGLAMVDEGSGLIVRGGFSVRYGNALSGMLAMESQNLPEASAYIRCILAWPRLRRLCRFRCCKTDSACDFPAIAVSPKRCFG